MCFGIIGPELEILTVGVDSLGLLLRFQTFREAAESVRALWLNFHGAAEAGLGFGGLAVAKIHPSEILDGCDVVGIEMQKRFKRFGGA